MFMTSLKLSLKNDGPKTKTLFTVSSAYLPLTRHYVVEFYVKDEMRKKC